MNGELHGRSALVRSRYDPVEAVVGHEPPAVPIADRDFMKHRSSPRVGHDFESAALVLDLRVSAPRLVAVAEIDLCGLGSTEGDDVEDDEHQRGQTDPERDATEFEGPILELVVGHDLLPSVVSRM